MVFKGSLTSRRMHEPDTEAGCRFRAGSLNSFRLIVHA